MLKNSSLLHIQIAIIGSSVSVYLVAAALSCWLLHAIYHLLISPLSDIPGPFWARYTRLWYLYKSNTGNFHLDNIKLHETYSKIIRVAPNIYSILDDQLG